MFVVGANAWFIRSVYERLDDWGCQLQNEVRYYYHEQIDFYKSYKKASTTDDSSF